METKRKFYTKKIFFYQNSSVELLKHTETSKNTEFFGRTVKGSAKVGANRSGGGFLHFDESRRGFRVPANARTGPQARESAQSTDTGAKYNNY